MTFRLGDRVRIDIPDETDPDHEYHSKHGVIIDVVTTVSGCGYGETYRVALEDHNRIIDLHPWDVRPPFTPEVSSRGSYDR